MEEGPPVPPIDRCLPSGHTLLTAAVEATSIEAIKRILAAGANPCVHNQFDRTPLEEAAYSGRVDIVELLLANSDEQDIRDRFGLSLLHIGCLQSNLPLVKFLLEKGYSPNVYDNFGTSPAFLALGNKSGEIFCLLLQHGADVNKSEVFGHSVFLKAIALGDTEAVKAILNSSQPAFDASNKFGKNVFHFAFGSEEHCDLFDILCSHVDKIGSLDGAIMGEFVKQALPTAVGKGCVDCCKRALQYVDINVTYDDSGTNLLQYAMTSPYPGSADEKNLPRVVLDDSHMPLIKTLIRGGASMRPVQCNVMRHLATNYQSRVSSTDLYLLYIMAWGAWYPKRPEICQFFRELALDFREAAAILVCWAGYSPTEEDLLVISNRQRTDRDRHHKPPPDLKSELTAMFWSQPRSLSNIAAVCIRQNLCDNIFHRVKSLSLPFQLEDIITLQTTVRHMGVQFMV